MSCSVALTTSTHHCLPTLTGAGCSYWLKNAHTFLGVFDKGMQSHPFRANLLHCFMFLTTQAQGSSFCGSNRWLVTNSIYFFSLTIPDTRCLFLAFFSKRSGKNTPKAQCILNKYSTSTFQRAHPLTMWWYICLFYVETEVGKNSNADQKNSPYKPTPFWKCQMQFNSAYLYLILLLETHE